MRKIMVPAVARRGSEFGTKRKDVDIDSILIITGYLCHLSPRNRLLVADATFQLRVINALADASMQLHSGFVVLRLF